MSSFKISFANLEVYWGVHNEKSANEVENRTKLIRKEQTGIFEKKSLNLDLEIGIGGIVEPGYQVIAIKPISDEWTESIGLQSSS